MQAGSESELGRMRREYASAALDEGEMAATWLEQFRLWLDQATRSQLQEPNAMVFATADERGHPSARTVLLKGVDERGLVLYTNLTSRKGLEADANPWASLVFPWFPMHRQVVVVGSVEAVDDGDADAYFAERPHGARLSACASPQSEVIPSRAFLEEARARLEERFPPGSEVPRPDAWGGLRVVPETVEFWQGRADRLHDRLRYRRLEHGGWVVERLAP